MECLVQRARHLADGVPKRRELLLDDLLVANQDELHAIGVLESWLPWGAFGR